MIRQASKTMFASLLIFLPTVALQATRGADDYGILMTVLFIVYTLPIGALLLLFILYTAITLTVQQNFKKRRGGIIFIISLVLIIPTVLLPLIFMSGANWDKTAVELMIGVFAPVLALTIISTVLAFLVKRRTIFRN